MPLVFLTIRRTFVTGDSGAPLSEVVRNVPWSAATPSLSWATASSFNDTRFSFPSLVVSCALTDVQADRTTRAIASLIVSFISSPSQLFEDYCVHELVDRLPVLGDTLF